MAVIEEPEQPITDRTRAILQSIDSKLAQLQDVSEAIREIKEQLNTGNTWRTAIIRALNQFLSHVDPNWKPKVKPHGANSATGAGKNHQ